MSNQEGKIKKILNSKITLFFLLLGFIWLVLNVVNVYYKKYQINKDLENLKAEIAKSEETNQQISSIIDYLNSQNFLEKEAREKLNMKKEGEEVVIVEPVKQDNITSSETDIQETQPPLQQNVDSSAIQPESNIIRWWRYFFR